MPGVPRSLDGLLGAGDDRSTRVVFHEYAHYLIHRNLDAAPPMWLDEGLAEFFSTFR